MSIRIAVHEHRPAPHVYLAWSSAQTDNGNTVLRVRVPCEAWGCRAEATREVRVTVCDLPQSAWTERGG